MLLCKTHIMAFWNRALEEVDPMKVNSQVIPKNVEHQDAETFFKITSL